MIVFGWNVSNEFQQKKSLFYSGEKIALAISHLGFDALTLLNPAFDGVEDRLITLYINYIFNRMRK
jgi:hypothetical protein